MSNAKKIDRLLSQFDVAQAALICARNELNLAIRGFELKNQLDVSSRGKLEIEAARFVRVRLSFRRIHARISKIGREAK